MYNLNNKIKFSLIKTLNIWSSSESKSGKGSEIKNTRVIRNILPKIIKKYNIKNMLDCPCGDMNYISRVLKKVNVKYTGIDIVDNIIQENKIKYPQYKFKQLNVIDQKLSNYDLILMKDLLNHLSFKSIKKIFKNIKNSKSKYLLLNNNNLKKNIEGFLSPAPFWNNINWKIYPWNLHVIEEFKADGKDQDYVLIKI